MITKATYRSRNLILYVILFFMFFSIISTIFPTTTKAVTASDWRAGRIIDDDIFFNKNAMSVSQIQTFLNSKVPVCDTNHNWSGWSYGYWNAPPFTCLKDFSENGKSSAQIIWEAGQSYDINPQVLLVLLQKETAIVTDTWAAPWQYKRAVGYKCPDSHLDPSVDANQNGCYDSHENFTAQVNGAAFRFRDYVNYPDSYNFKAGVTRNILWQVGGVCGSSPVYIENSATAALYNYTPYQPNQAALNNMYGTGDGCSAYGNRNFWRMFNDWFGSTINRPFGNKFSYQSVNSRQSCNISAIPSNAVGRLYQPDQKDYLFTKNQYEACLATKYGYIWDGIAFFDPGNIAGTTPVHRMSRSGKHVYTSSTQVKDQYVNEFGFGYEGVVFYGYTSPDPAQKIVQVYHMGNNATNILTLNEGEKLLNEAYLGYYNYGVAFYAKAPVEYGPSVPINRLSSWTRGKLYTTSEVEKNNALIYGFNPEYSSFITTENGSAASSPVYRLRSPSGQFFYTNSRPERDFAVISFDYLSEGVGFYGRIYPSGNGKPVYRLTKYSNGNRLYTDSSVEKDLAIRNHGFTLEGIAWYEDQ